MNVFVIIKFVIVIIIYMGQFKWKFSQLAKQNI